MYKAGFHAHFRLEYLTTPMGSGQRVLEISASA